MNTIGQPERATQKRVPEPKLSAEHSGLWTTFQFTTVAQPQADPVADPVGDPMHRLVLAIGGSSLAPSEIQRRLRLKHRPTFRENYLRPALQQGWVEMTLPDKPNSRLQRYRLTPQGKAMLAGLQKRESKA